MKDQVWELVIDIIDATYHANISKSRWNREINGIIGEIEDVASRIERDIDEEAEDNRLA